MYFEVIEQANISAITCGMQYSLIRIVSYFFVFFMGLQRIFATLIFKGCTCWLKEQNT